MIRTADKGKKAGLDQEDRDWWRHCENELEGDLLSIVRQKERFPAGAVSIGGMPEGSTRKALETY